MEKEPSVWEYMIMPLKKYSDFKGRSRRKEYWYFTLLMIIIIVPLAFTFGVLSESGNEEIGMIPIGILVLFVLALFVPSLAVTVRRLHDTGRSGWWYLVSLIPYVGNLILIIFTVQDSKPGSNQWGPNPKEQGELDITDHLVD